MNTTPYILMTVAFAALIHSGFSLGASMLSLLSGHSLSRKRSHARLLNLAGSFVGGTFAMILLLLMTFAYIGLLLDASDRPVSWLVVGTLTMLSGIWVLFFYYRRGRAGSALWLPRSFARYLTERTARTKSITEAFVLGAASVIYELPAVLWLLLAGALSITSLHSDLQLLAVVGYGVIAISSLMSIFVLIGGGHTGAAFTKFRQQYKRFLQTIIGLSMIALGASLFWNNYYAALGAQGFWIW